MFMQIIKNREITDSPWQPDCSITASPGEGPVDWPAEWVDHTYYSVERWQSLRASEAELNSTVGIRLAPEDDVDELAADLLSISMIALEFGSFSEGRGYSQAVLLRQQYGYSGEIRALGAHCDNLPLMERCGIDAFELAQGEDLETALKAFEEITEYYPYN